MQTKENTTNVYFKNENIKLQNIYTNECKNSKDKDECYSTCVFMTDFKTCL